MALRKTTSSPSGHESNYHRIAQIVHDTRVPGGRTNVTIDLHKDAAARTAEKPPTEQYTVSVSSMPSSVQDCYNKLKALPEFQGAEDC
jgi:hypothetical protein